MLAISGPSGSFKTRLIMDLLVSCVSPIALGGWGNKAAVVFDMQSTFDIASLKQMLSAKVDDSTLVDAALRQIHVFRPQSTAQLAASIVALPRYQRKKVKGDIALVVVDSMSSFYWTDRYSGSSAALEHVLLALRAFRASHRPLIALTNWALTLVDADPSAVPVYKQHLPVFPTLSESPSDTGSLTHDIVLQPQPVAEPNEDTVSANEVTGYIRKSGSNQVVTFPVLDF
uniref:DNA recombination and repair protein Rad51-like C-terminal domain-containing protein n=1 Tax=Mycena chlorophos TaxID=658473 RepID=A0ABQ0LB75_MYCCL|nr:predicted protein [Mycena chlorophos]